MPWATGSVKRGFQRISEPSQSVATRSFLLTPFALRSTLLVTGIPGHAQVRFSFLRLPPRFGAGDFSFAPPDHNYAKPVLSRFHHADLSLQIPGILTVHGQHLVKPHQMRSFW